MKNKFLAFLLSISLFSPLMAENLNIQSSEISIDKKTRLTIFKGDVVGSIDIIIPGRKNIKLDLLAGEDISHVNFFTGFIRSLDYFLYKDE